MPFFYVPEYRGPVCVRWPSGDIQTYPTPRALLRAHPEIWRAAPFGVPPVQLLLPDGTACGWLEVRRWAQRRQPPAAAPFRRAPVPRHWPRRGGGGGHRYPSTQSERRAWAACEDQETADGMPLRVRVRRKAARLPTAWDDIQRSGGGNGWKKHRATQWRPVKGALAPMLE